MNLPAHPPNSPETPAVSLRYASFWQRKWAYAIDVVVVMILASIATGLLGGVAHAQSTAELQALIDAGLIPATVNAADLSAAFAQFGLGKGEQSTLLFDIAVSLAVSALYNILFVASHWQATPGKRLLHLQVVMRDGSRPRLAAATMRHLANGLSMLLFGLGYLTMAFMRDKATLHDLMSHTRVVVNRPAS